MFTINLEDRRDIAPSKASNAKVFLTQKVLKFDNFFIASNKQEMHKSFLQRTRELN